MPRLGRNAHWATGLRQKNDALKARDTYPPVHWQYVGSLRGRFGLLTGQMSIPRCDPIESNRFTAAPCRCRLRPEIEFNRLPGVPALSLQAKTRRWLIPAMDHAVLATAVARHPVDDSVFIPLHLLQHF